MADPRDRNRRQAPPGDYWRENDQEMESPAPPHQTVSAQRPAQHSDLPAPAIAHGGQRSVREAARSIDRAERGLSGDTLYQSYGYGQDAQEDEFREAYYQAVALAPREQDFYEAHPDAPPPCACEPRCPCKPACRYQIHGCPCAPCIPFPTIARSEAPQPSRNFEAAEDSSLQQQNFTGYTLQPRPFESENTLPDRSLTMGSAPRQELQYSASHRREDNPVEPLHSRRQRTRTRTNTNGTNNPDLAYVPAPAPRTPSRKLKDPHPLAFFGSHSGQRYPPFNISSSQASSSSPSAVPAAPSISETSQAGGSSAHAVSPLRSPTYVPYQHNRNRPTLGSNQDFETVIARDPIQDAGPLPSPVTYSGVPRSTSLDLFSQGTQTITTTQSFPFAQTGNPRDPETNPEQAYHALHHQDFAYHPAGNGRSDSNDLVVPTRHSSPASTSGAFGPGGPPPLPLPDFIAPRPATKQRYVSAGGNAKLADRPEIENFVLPPSVVPGISMPRDQVLQRLENTPQFITPPSRSFFNAAPSTTRASGESAMTDGSNRVSYEDPDQQGTKRDRKESGSSQRLARFKRVFSFKDSKDGKDATPS